MLLFLAAGLSLAQTKTTPHELFMLPQVRTPQAKVGSEVDVRVGFELRQGFHVQSNTPSDPYYIPLKLTWNAGLLRPGSVVYPKPKMERYSFSKTPLSVFTDSFEVATKFQVPPGTPPGPTPLTAKVRYQACRDDRCQPPRDLDITVRVNVVP